MPSLSPGRPSWAAFKRELKPGVRVHIENFYIPHMTRVATIERVSSSHIYVTWPGQAEPSPINLVSAAKATVETPHAALLKHPYKDFDWLRLTILDCPPAYFAERGTGGAA